MHMTTRNYEITSNVRLEIHEMLLVSCLHSSRLETSQLILSYWNDLRSFENRTSHMNEHLDTSTSIYFCNIFFKSHVI